MRKIMVEPKLKQKSSTRKKPTPQPIVKSKPLPKESPDPKKVIRDQIVLLTKAFLDCQSRKGSADLKRQIKSLKEKLEVV